MTRLGALAGIAAPLSFVTGWVVGGARAHHYDPLKDAISELARVDAPTRPVMTAGFLGFSLFAVPWGRALARSLGVPALQGTVGLAAAGTAAVAALPLGGPGGVRGHAAAAGLAYVGMAASPVLGARGLTGSGRVASYAAGGVSAAALVGSVVVEHGGGLQRLGLTVVDAWFVTMAVRALRS